MSADLNLDKRVARKYLDLIETSAKRGKDFNLSLQSLRNIYRAKRCYYTGVKLTLSAGLPHSVTIDRVDSDKGYITGNVVACCGDFNNKKANINPSDVELLYLVLKKRGEL